MIGRNDPCPCGSGRKFKKCCLDKNGPAAPLYLPAERSSALAKLMHFAGKAKYEALHHAAFALFWGDWLAETPDARMREVMASESVEIAYNSWFGFDFDCGDGRRTLEMFLESSGRGLSSGELRYLQGMRDSHLRLYEISK